VPIFAIVDTRARGSVPLMLLDDRTEAEAIAAELRRRRSVAVVVIPDCWDSSIQRRAG
jgi:hypothetical protein